MIRRTSAKAGRQTTKTKHKRNVASRTHHQLSTTAARGRQGPPRHVLAAVFILALVGLGVFTLINRGDFNLTGLVTQTDVVTQSLVVATSTLSEVPFGFNETPTSLSVTGRLLGTGDARITFVSGNASFVVYDSAVGTQGLGSLTGNAVVDTTLTDGQVSEAEQVPSDEQVLADEQAPIDKQLVPVIEESTNASVANATTNATTDETANNVTNGTSSAADELLTDKTISTILTYGSDTQWDVHNNGVEAEGQVIDVDVSGSEFSWSADSDKTCTRWTIADSTAREAETCTGSVDCCAFLGLNAEAGVDWKTLQIYDGRYGAVAVSTITAQVVYYDVNLSLENLRTDVLYSQKTEALPLRWVPISEVRTFEDRCQESCTLPTGVMNGTLRIEVTGDATVELLSVSYELKFVPQLVWNGPENVSIAANSSWTGDISTWFIPNRGNAKVTYDVQASVNLNATLSGNVLTIVPDAGFIGERDVTIVATAESLRASRMVTVVVDGVVNASNLTGAVRIILKNKDGAIIGDDVVGENETKQEINIKRNKTTNNVGQGRGHGFGVQAQGIGQESVSVINSITFVNPRATGDVTGFIDALDPSNATDSIGTKLQTDVVALPSELVVDSAELVLQKSGPVTGIVTCPLFNFTSQTCPRWERARVPFVDNGTHIAFNVTHFSGYAGANITIINVQSYPMVGGNWTVRFNTTGTANLTIIPYNDTTFIEYPIDIPETEDDLSFIGIFCEDVPIAAERVLNNTRTTAVIIANYACSGSSAEASLVLTTGAHYLRFEYGDDVGFAQNDAWSTVEETDFDLGTYEGTDYNATGKHVLVGIPGNLSGNYTSKVYNAGASATWKNISWVSSVTGELPNNRQNEVSWISGNVNMTQNMVLLHMSESSGLLLDSSGQGFNFSSTNVNYNKRGRFGTAIEVGNNAYINVTDNDLLDFPDNLTIETWLLIPSGAPTGSLCIIDKSNSYILQVLTNNFLQFQPGGYSSTTSTLNFTYDVWHHIAVTFTDVTPDGQDASYVYIDGVIAGSTTGMWGAGPQVSLNPIVIGACGTLPGPYGFLNATLDEFAIYNRTLSSAEIADRFLRGATRLNFSARSCDDATCAGESFVDINDSSLQNLSLVDNQYFQYRVNFDTSNASATPRLYNVSVGFNATTPAAVTTPVLAFVGQTWPHNTIINNNTISINISINNTANLSTFIWNWNNSNYTLYNQTLLLFLNFDNTTLIGENTTTVVDVSIYNRSSNLSGNVSRYSSGWRGFALNFTYYDVLNMSINLSTTWTIQTWFRSPLPGYTWATLTRGLTLDHQVIVYEGRDLGTYDNTATGFNDCGYNINALSTGWHHLTAVGNSDSKTYFYIDGSYVCVSNYRSTTDIYSIGNYHGGTQPFGVLDEFKIWNMSLSAADIQQQYYGGLTKLNSSTWNFYYESPALRDANYSYAANVTDFTTGNGVTGLRNISIDLPRVNATSYYPMTSLQVTPGTLINVTINVTCQQQTCDRLNVSLGGTGNWWNSSWPYRQRINVSTASGSTDINYQVNITLNSTNVGSNFNWSLACKDLRFTGASGTALLDYYVESCNPSTSRAYIWVEYDAVITTNATSLYMYYGNTAATNVSNGKNTFLLWDTFNGTSLDPQWTATTTGTATVTVANDMVDIQYASSGNYATISGPNSRTGAIMESYMKLTSTGTMYLGCGFAGAYAGSGSYLHIWTGSYIGLFLGWKDVWHTYKWVSTGTNVEAYMDGVAGVWTTDPRPVAWAVYPTCGNSGEAGRQGEIWIDWMRIRAYAASEPTSYFNSEEIYLDSLLTGYLSNVSGMQPFYMLSGSHENRNPQEITLAQDEFTLVSWIVNTTGTAGQAQFVASVNRTYGLEVAQSLYFNVSIDGIAPNINQMLPASGFNTTGYNITFMCNASDNIALQNLSLHVWSSNGTAVYTNTTNFSNTYSTLNASFDLPGDGVYTWNCLGTDVAGNKNWSTNGNYTVIYNARAAIAFVNPTIPNNTMTTNTSVLINVSILNETDLKEFIWNWNGTNYSMYNDSLVLMMNFDNVSTIGENSTHVKDLSRSGNNGSCINCPQWNTTGRYGGSLQYNRSSNLSIFPLLQNATTFGFWLQPNHVLYGRMLRTGNGVFIGHRSGNLSCDGCASATMYIDGIQTSNYSAGQWHYITILLPNASVSGNVTLGGGDPDNIYSSQSVAEDGTATLSCTGTRVITNYSSYYCTSGGTLTACGSCTYGSTSCSVTYNNGNCGDCWPFFVKQGTLSINCSDPPASANLDELRIWNYTLSATEREQQMYSNLYKFDVDKWAFYTNQSIDVTGNYSYFAVESDTVGNSNQTGVQYFYVDFEFPVVRSMVPITDINVTTLNGTIMCNISNGGVVQNITSYVWNATGGLIFTGNTTLSGAYATANWSFNFIGEGTYQWNCLGYDLLGRSNWSSDGNRTIALNLIPSISFVNPTIPNNTQTTNTSVLINVSILNETALKQFIWNWNGTNYSMYNDSLVLMMNFDNVSTLGENATHVKDLSKWGNNGTCYSGSLQSCNWSTLGRYNGALSFDGVDDRLNVSSISLSSITGDMTFSYWLKLNGSGTALASIDASVGWRLINRHSGDGSSSFDIYTVAWKSLSTSAGSHPGSHIWFHFVYTRKGSTGKIHIDSIEKGSTASQDGAVNTGSVLTVMDRGDGNYEPVNGSIDNLHIWNRSLSQVEITQEFYSNLYKFDVDKWAFWTNQSNLTSGNYSYFAYASDTIDNFNQTGVQYVAVDNRRPVVAQMLPASGFNTTTYNITFMCNATDDIALQNMTLYVWNSTGTAIYTNTTNFSNSYSTLNTSYIVPSEGIYKWNCLGTDTFGNQNWSTSGNYTVTYNARAAIAFVNPTIPNNTMTTNTSVLINVSVLNETDLKQFIWNWNGTNYSMYNDSLVLMMNFDNVSSLGENLTHVKDLSKYGNNATVFNSSVDCLGSKSGCAIAMNGTVGYMTVNLTTNISASGTVSLWVKLADLKNFTNIFSYGDSDSTDNVISLVKTHYNTLEFIMTNATTGEYAPLSAGGTLPTISDWSFVTITWNTTNISFYSNGVLSSTTGMIRNGLGAGRILTFGAGEIAWFDNFRTNSISSWGQSGTPTYASDGTVYFGAAGYIYFYLDSDGVAEDWDFYFTFNEPVKDGVEGIEIAVGFTGFPGGGVSFDRYEAVNTYRIHWGGGERTTESVTLTANTFHRGLITKRGASVAFYVDDNQIGTTQNIGSDYDTSSFAINNGPANTGTAKFDDIRLVIVDSNGNKKLQKKLNGTIDELRIWNRSLSGNEIQQQYYGTLSKYDVDKWTFFYNFTGNSGNYSYFATAIDSIGNLNQTGVQSVSIDNRGPVVNSMLPASGFNSTTLNISFMCNATDDIGLQNITLSLWNASGSLLYTNTTNFSNTYSTLNASYVVPMEGSYRWNCLGTDTFGNQNWSTSGNATVAYTTRAAISFVNPTLPNATMTANTFVLVNVSILNETDLNQFIWNWNGTNYTLYNDSLVLMMNFDNVSAIGENTTSAKDIGPLRNNMTCYNDVTPSCNWTLEGYHNGAIRFDGVDDHTEIPDSDALGPQTSKTISFWFKGINASSASSSSLPLYHADSGATYRGGWWFEFYSNNILVFVVENTGSSVFSAGTTVSPGRWTHVTARINDTKVYAYFDGQNVSENSYTGILDNPTGTMRLAEAPNVGGYGGFHFNGTLDELVMWNRALSSREILQTYYSTLSKYDVDKWVFWSNQSSVTSGNYSYFAAVRDSVGNVNQTEVRLVSVDNQGLSLYQMLPTSGFNSTTYNITFMCNATDDIGLQNITLYVWNSSGAIQYTNTTNFSNTYSTLNASYVVPTEGVYKWNCLGTDTFGNQNWSMIGNYSVTYNARAAIAFVNPTILNNTLTTNTSVVINVSVLNETDLKQFIWNWNGTNYSMYNDSLVLMMNFDNVSALGENATHVKDLSKWGNNGTISGATWNSSGRYQGAYSFDGLDDYVSVTDASSLDYRDMTISVWVKPSGFGCPVAPYCENMIVGKDDVGSNREFTFGTTNATYKNVLSFDHWFSGGSHNAVTSTTNITVDGWYQLVGSIQSNGVFTIYVNGVNESSAITTENLANKAVNLTIGKRHESSYPYPFNGTIDEVRIWNRSLSGAEVKQQYYSNLYKFDVDKWAFYTNQTLNISNRGVLTYRATAIDSLGNLNSTELRQLTILNTPPVLGPIILNTTLGMNSTNENLTLWITSANDTNRDAVTNITNWFVDNVSITVLNMPFDTNVSTNATNAVRDYSPYQNNGTLGNGTSSSRPTWNVTSCIRGGCYVFDGVDDFINLSETATLNHSQSFSLVLWAKLSNTSNPYGPFYLKRADANNRLEIGPGAGIMFFAVSNGTGTFDFTLANYSEYIHNNSWHHYAFTSNSTQLAMYIDGLQVKTANYSAFFNISASTVIGARHETSSFFTGAIDELQTYNRSLSLEQIKALYLNRTDLIVANETESGQTWYANVTPNDGFEDGITVMSNAITIRVTQAPAIVNITTPALASIVEAGMENLTFGVTVEDNDTRLDMGNVNLTFSFQSTSRINTSCRVDQQLSTVRQNYSCTVSLWYFDPAGVWSVNATAVDLSGQVTPAYGTPLVVMETTAITVGPSNITWSQLLPGMLNATAAVNITINNTGNKNITPNNITINATDLVGLTNPAFYLPVTNFSIGADWLGDSECAVETVANMTLNNTFVNIVGANLSRGNLSQGSGTAQEVLYLCLREVPTSMFGSAFYPQRYVSRREWILQVN